MKNKILQMLDAQGRSVLLNSAMSLILRLSAAAFGFGFTLTIARKFGPEGAGQYSLVLTTIWILRFVALLGADNAIIKYVAAASAKNDKEEVSRLISSGFAIVFSIASVLTLAAFSARGFLVEHYYKDPVLYGLLTIMFFTIIPFSLLKFVSSCLNGLRQYIGAQMTDGLLVPMISLIAIFLLAVEGIERATSAFLVGVLVATGLGFFLLVRAVGSKAILPFGGGRKMKLARTGVPTLGIVIGNYMTEAAPVMTLAYFATTSDIGLFRISWQLMLFLSVLSLAVNTVVTPIISAHYHDRKHHELARLYNLSIGILALVAFPILLVLVLLPEFILSLFGAEFIAADQVLIVLALGQFVYCTFGVTGRILLMTGHERKSLVNSLLSAVLAISLCFYWVPQYGAVGAAMAAVSSQIFQIFVSTFLVWKYVGLLPFARTARAIEE